MKSVLSLVVLLVSISALSQQYGGGRYNPGRGGGDYRGGGHQQHPPAYGNDYGPNYTVRWEDFGANRVPKFAGEDVVIYTHGQFVNELRLTAVNNDVQITSALAYLSNGEVIELRQATGYFRQGRTARAVIDYRNSRTVDRIVLTATSPNLIGSRAQLSAVVGYAY
jgi:hypothetical protein